MIRSYRMDEPNEVSVELAKKVADLVVSRSVTYKEAEDALDAAAVLLRDMKPYDGKPIPMDFLDEKHRLSEAGGIPNWAWYITWAVMVAALVLGVIGIAGL